MFSKQDFERILQGKNVFRILTMDKYEAYVCDLKEVNINKIIKAYRNYDKSVCITYMLIKDVDIQDNYIKAHYVRSYSDSKSVEEYIEYIPYDRMRAIEEIIVKEDVIYV